MSAEHAVTVYGTAVLVCAPDGIPIDTEGAATDLVGEAVGQRTAVVVIPVERLTGDFFDLSTGIAAAIAQKFATYQLRLVIIGDLTQHVAAHPDLAALVRESNAGQQLWFLETFDDLQARLDRRTSPRPE